MSDLASRRADYESAGLDVADVDPSPVVQWQQWYSQATEAGCVEPHAFVLSTVDDQGWPQSRYLLARGADERGFSFFTNYESAKGAQLLAEPRAAMLFTWLQLHRQTRVVGVVERLPEVESDAYFASRPRGSQIGAWASPQSQVLPDRWVRADFCQRRRHSTPGLLGRMAASPGFVRVLAGPAQSFARPSPLSPSRHRERRQLGHRAVGSVAHDDAASTKPSISAAMGGTICVWSQSAQIGLEPRIRGGNSI
jgi:pyridoxamine-phosphate oxidase